MDIQTLLSSIKTLNHTDLFKLLKQTLAEVEKKSKTAATTTKKAAATAKKSSMPKGVVPPQLKKPRAWVDYTLKNALENGWEAFTITQKKKDKMTGETTEEVIEMPGSIMVDGAYVYDHSDAPHLEGKQLIHKDAMSLSKQRKTSGHESYAEFEAQYTDEVDESASETASTTSSKKSKASTVVKKTAAEKAAEMELAKAEKKAEKEKEKEAKKAEKEKEKEAKKAQAMAEKEAKKAEKAQAMAEKSTPAKVPVKAITKAEEQEPKEQKPVEAKEQKPVAIKKKTVVPKVEEIPNDDQLHPWTYNGKKYLRNYQGETWMVGEGGSLGKWVGLYDATTNKIDTTAEEPVFEDDE